MTRANQLNARAVLMPFWPFADWQNFSRVTTRGTRAMEVTTGKTKERKVSGQISGDLSRGLDIIRVECRVSHEFRKKLAGERKVLMECHLIDSTRPPSSLDGLLCTLLRLTLPHLTSSRVRAVLRRTSSESRGIRAVGTCAGSRKVLQIERSGRGSLPLQV